MLEPYFLTKSGLIVEDHWRQKTLIASEIMRKTALRNMRPNLIGDRMRLDLMWNGKALGIRGKSDSSGNFSFFPVIAPDTPSEAIAMLMKDFLADPVPFEKCQIRFRSGVGGLAGIWIDTSNEAILKILEEGKWLERWLKKGVVIEAGQKQKEVVPDSSRGLKLALSAPRNWLPSFDVNNEPIHLVSRICQFSQAGTESNRALIAAAFELLDDSNIFETPWIEWGAGYGNLSAAFRSRLGDMALVTESEPGVMDCLEMNQKAHLGRIKILNRSAESGLPAGFTEPEIWIMDPPRPGFGTLLSTLKSDSKLHRPRFVLAYHCHASGLISDAKHLRDGNYELVNWSSVDVFPATPHLEVISLWTKRDR